MNNLAEEIFGKDRFDLTKSTTGRESVKLQAFTNAIYEIRRGL
jgi:hypothetical protein